MKIDALLASDNNEWHTPEEIITSVRKVLGTIDLDPASCAAANKVIAATKYYTKEENGLLHRWPGKVFLNPPYGRTGGKSNQALWSSRLISQYEQGITKEAILLVNAATSEQWFQPLYDYLICFPVGRIRFSTPEKADAASPTHGSALVYFGPNKKHFIQIFNQFGPVMKSVSPPRKVYVVSPELFGDEEK